MPKTKRSVNILLVAICAIGLAFGVNAADVIIHLRNGDRVTGKITGETPTEVTLQSPTLGKIIVPVGQILKRDEVVATNAPASAASTNTVATTTLTNVPAATAKAPATPAPAPKPVVIVTKPAEPKHWNTEIQFGLNLRYTTRDQQEALVIAKSTYSKNHFREILDYNFTWGKTEETQTANKMYGSSKTEYDLTPKWYLFGLAGAGYDEIRLIDRQVEADPGVGYQWIKTPDLVFKTEVGFGYQDQIFKGAPDAESYSGRLAGIFTWRIYDKLTADGRLEYFPNLLSIHEYRFRAESTLRYPLSKILSLNLNVIDIYDTQAPPGVQNNDLQLRSAIGVKF
jgi:putative salt-induced outer membrane protein YdiY